MEARVLGWVGVSGWQLFVTTLGAAPCSSIQSILLRTSFISVLRRVYLSVLSLQPPTGDPPVAKGSRELQRSLALGWKLD